MTDVDAGRIRRSAMGLLARREYSFSELKSRLETRFPDLTGCIIGEVERLKDEGLQSDQRLCESQIRSRVNRGQGPIRIRSELRQKGISEALIDQSLADIDVDWFEVIHRVKAVKYGDQPAIDMKQKGKIARFLQQRGFTFEQINEVI